MTKDFIVGTDIVYNRAKTRQIEYLNIEETKKLANKVSKGHTGTTHFWVNLQKPYANTKYVEIEYSNAHFKIPLNH